MLKVFATQVVISRGFDNKPAISISKSSEMMMVRFRIGKKVYDPKAPDSTRWINLSVKGFGQIVERIEKMQLKEGSYVNIMGRLDEDTWEDQNTHEKKSTTVVILEDIEYASSGGKSKDNNQANGQTNGANNAAVPTAPAPASVATGDNGGGFTGYEPFGGNSFFDEK